MLPSALLDLVSSRLSSRVNVAFINSPRRTGDSIRRAQRLLVQNNVRGVGFRPITSSSIGEGSTQHAASPLMGVVHPPATTLQGTHVDALENSKNAQPTSQFISRTIVELEPQFMIQILQTRVPEFEAAAQKLALAVGPQDGAPIPKDPTPPSGKTVPIPAVGDTSKSVPQKPDTEKNRAREERRVIIIFIRRLRVALDSLETSLAFAETNTAAFETFVAPFRLVAREEWRVFSQACVTAKDAYTGQLVLDLMKRLELLPSDDQKDAILDSLARKGLVQEADAYAAKLTNVPTEHQRHLLVKVRLKARQFHDACTLLHSLEKRGIPAAMESYRLVITEFLIQPGTLDPTRRQQVWDLFMHMREVARRTPDAALFDLMLGSTPELKLSLDLFEEMTVDWRIMPSNSAYNILVKNCARSKELVSHAFRLARHPPNIGDSATDTPSAPLKLQGDTLCALMKAASQTNNLSHARWVFTQLSKRLKETTYVGKDVVNFISTAMFHAYAAYHPPANNSGRKPFTPLPPKDKTSTLSDTLHVETPGLPQTSQEVSQEATQLWERIIEDCTSSEITPVHSRSFRSVVLRPQLVNAYMVVLYKHTLPSELRDFKHTLVDFFKSAGIRPDAFSYVLSLEAYSNNTNLSESEQSIALSMARNVWRGWLSLNRTTIKQWHNLNAREEANLVSRAWGAMLRHLTHAKEYEEAEEFIRAFVQRYPPPNPIQSEYEMAENIPPKMFTPPTSLTTPYLTYYDIAPMHRYACATERPELVRYLTWVTYAYKGRSSSIVQPESSVDERGMEYSDP